MSIYSPSVITQPPYQRNRNVYSTVKAMSNRTATVTAAAAPERKGSSSAFEARFSLVLALASQTSSLSQRRTCSHPFHSC